jgi:ankyrin repeat protein
MNETGLHYAVRAGQKDIIQTLIECGADVNIKSEDGTPFQLSPSPEITKFMEAAGMIRMNDTHTHTHHNLSTTSAVVTPFLTLLSTAVATDRSIVCSIDLSKP